jgi:hypothetical protein
MLKVIEDDENERERIRAATEMADYRMMQNWKLYNSALNPPVDKITCIEDFISRRAVRGTDAVQHLFRKFWRERV